MQILDKRGRLLGLINIFDLVVVLVVAFILGFVYINKTFHGKLSKEISDVPELEYVTIDVILPENLGWMKRYINVGDVMGTFHGKRVREILEVREVEGYGQEKRLVVKIRTFATKDKMRALSFGRETLKIGEGVEFSTSKYTFKGNIIGMTATGEKVDLGD